MAAEHQVNEAGPMLEGFPLVVGLEVQWGEMDGFGHVNNVHFFRYFEAARVAFFDAVEFREGARVGPILASTQCRFRRPLTYPDRLHVGVRVSDVQADRFTHEYRLVSQGLGEIAAVGEGLVVSYDYERGVKAPIPKNVLDKIEQFGLPRQATHSPS